MLHEALTDMILGTYYKVYNGLGHGFLEKVYQNALVLELNALGFRVTQYQPIKVYYQQTLVGDYIADLVVNDKVILELKAAESLRNEHVSQLMNYLKATDIELGLLLNFGLKPEFKRVIFTNRKPDIQGRS